MKLKFVHTSDWHLGFTQYNKTERYTDFIMAARKTIKKIIQIKPDFVLHTGDLFHDPRPTPGTIKEAIKILKDLDKAGIPMYVIRGNHDGKDSIYLDRGGGIISLLRELELLHYINDEIVEVPDLGCQILGVGYYPYKGVVNKINEILVSENLTDDYFTILAIHAFVEGQLEDYSQLSLKSVADLGFDYIGAGHHHIPWIREDKRIYAPGSSEATAITDANRDDMINEVSMYSSFFEVNVEKSEGWGVPEVIQHMIPVRPKILLNYETSLTEIKAIRKELEDKFEEKIDTILETESVVAEEVPVVRVILKTSMDFERNQDILIEDWLRDRALHITTQIDGQGKTEEKMKELRSLHNIEDVFKELIEINDLDIETRLDHFFDLTQTFGTYPVSRELNDQEKDAITQLLKGKGSLKDLLLPEPADEEEEVITLEEEDVFQDIDTDDHEIGLDVFDDLLGDE
ncbi:MAG: DNA repair exonuclease [Candidatus Kariarchaeaceae archaeon]|jgi:DNA repair exonuclease SbcCD nuclease subunit